MASPSIDATNNFSPSEEPARIAWRNSQCHGVRRALDRDLEPSRSGMPDCHQRPMEKCIFRDFVAMIGLYLHRVQQLSRGFVFASLTRCRSGHCASVAYSRNATGQSRAFGRPSGIGPLQLRLRRCFSCAGSISILAVEDGARRRHSGLGPGEVIKSSAILLVLAILRIEHSLVLCPSMSGDLV